MYTWYLHNNIVYCVHPPSSGRECRCGQCRSVMISRISCALVDHIYHHVRECNSACCLVHRPPTFFVLRFALSKTRKWRNSEERERRGLIHHVNDVRWTRGGHKEEGPNGKTTHWIICSRTLPHFWTSDIRVVETTRLHQ